MVMYAEKPARTELYKRFERPTPEWYWGEGLGIWDCPRRLLYSLQFPSLSASPPSCQ